MSKRMVPPIEAGESTVLEELRKRGEDAGDFADDFANGYGERDAIMRAARMIREVRIDAGLTQAELAARAGMSQPDISRLESGLGKQGPSVETLYRLTGACGLQFVMGTRKPAESFQESWVSVKAKHLEAM